MEKHGQRKCVVEDVPWIKPECDALQLVTFLRESRRFQKKIKSVDLVNGFIVLEVDAT